MKTNERDEARRLRREQGLSIKEIERRLGVARSSVSRWVHEIELTPEQHEALRQANPVYNNQRTGQAAMSAKCRARRARWQEQGRAVARRGDALHAAGCMLFWAEGDKALNRVALSNADPHVLIFFLRFLRRYFRVPDEKVRVMCHLFADHIERQRDVEQFWLDVLGLPTTCLTKSVVNNYSKASQRKRVNRLPYGTGRITVHSVAIVQSIYGAIQEYGGFDRPEWLG